MPSNPHAGRTKRSTPCRLGAPPPACAACPPQGCDSIDDALLHTGLRTGQVVEVCGESGEPAPAPAPASMPPRASGQLTASRPAPTECQPHARCARPAFSNSSPQPAGPLPPAPAASGKTQLCMAAAVQAARAGLRVVYVDTSNALRGRRLEEMEAAQRRAHGDPQACRRARVRPERSRLPAPPPCSRQGRLTSLSAPHGA